MVIAFGNPLGIDNLLIIGNVQAETTYIRRSSTAMNVSIPNDDLKNIMKDATRFLGSFNE
jgi:hypothetical protein